MPVHVVAATHPVGRLDAFVAQVAPGLSRRLIRLWIAEGAIRVDGRFARKGSVVRAGQVVSIADGLTLAPDPSLGFVVLHEDRWMVAIDKPGRVASHALDPRDRGSVANFLAGRFPETSTCGRPGESGLVHRLDAGTSGVLLAARNPAAYEALRAAFTGHAVEKTYLALVRADVPVRAATIDVALAHDPGDRRRMIPARAGMRAWPARSMIVPVRDLGGSAVVRVVIGTGVTHQVRVHLATSGHPVVGDLLYGSADPRLAEGRHALHAETLTLPDGPWGAGWSVVSALPPDLARLIAPDAP